MEAEGKLDAASKYDSISVGQREVGLYLMGKLAPAVGSKVLDLGCGTGYLTKVLADRMGPEGKVSLEFVVLHMHACSSIKE